MTAPPLRWTDDGDGCWTAVGHDGTEWEIRDFGAGRYGITVAHWDHPDWWTASVEAAMELAAEIDARLPIPREEWVVEREVVVPARGDEHATYGTDAAPPAGPCPWCGTAEPARAVKPRRGTTAWWDDPSPFWQCSACTASLGDVEEWPYDIPREEFFAQFGALRPPPSQERPRRRWWRRRAH